MRSLRPRVASSIVGFLLLLLPSLAAAGGGKATPLENVADTRDMTPGFAKFLADTYNANLWLFGLYVVLIMAAMGAILGFGVDKLMSFTGIGMGKIDHHE
jgi:hypothetical protein